MKKWLITAASPFPAAIDYYGMECEDDPIDVIYDEIVDNLWDNYHYMLGPFESDEDVDDAYVDWIANCTITTEEVDEFPEETIMYE